MSIEQDLHRRFKKPLWSKFLKAIRDYELLKEGDHVGVCVSGGKDSTLMAKLFNELSKYSDYPFSVSYIVMDPGYPEGSTGHIRDLLASLGINPHIYSSSIFDTVAAISEGSPCYICARMRRGHLYAYARDLGCNKIALAHHYDDVIETILMGMLFGAQIQSMRPKLKSLHFPGMELIRPMYLIREDDIRAWGDAYGLDFSGSGCALGECEDKGRRALAKRLIRELKAIDPDIDKHIFKSSDNVMLDTLLGYKLKGTRHHFLDDY